MDYKYDQKTGKETLSPNFRTHLKNINTLVEQSDSQLEGNLFYLNHRKRTEPVTSSTLPDKLFLKKRLNYLKAIEGRKKMVEIGFNAGHSSLLALITNQNLSYVGIDIARYQYTKPCAEYLEKSFPGRFKCFFGDSAKVFPLIELDELLDCDLIHIDGGHSLEQFIIDLTHALTLPNPKKLERFILVDDSQAPHIQEKISEMIKRNFIVNITEQYDWLGNQNIMLKVDKSNF